MSQPDDSSNSTICRTRGHGRWQAIVCKVDAYRYSAAGATAIEYGLIAAGIAVAIIVAVFQLGDELEAFFNEVQAELFACEDSSSASDRGLEKGKGRRCK